MSNVDLSNALYDALSLDDRVRVLGHPDEVLRHPDLTTAEKRQILADWASDAHAVPDEPSLRQLDSGAVVAVDAVFDALRALDSMESERVPGAIRTGHERRRRPAIPRLRVLWKRRDDDDDPPPSPAAALPFELALARTRKWDPDPEPVAA